MLKEHLQILFAILFKENKKSILVRMHACMLSRFSCVWLFAILWTIVPPGPWTIAQSSVHGILQERRL